MNTTILTDEQIIRILEENRSEYDGLDKAIAVSRAIEQAVLQSLKIQVRQWEPIETAPKDFVTEFDGWNGERILNVIWAHPDFGAEGEYTWCRWCYEHNYGWTLERVEGLTHWMPLPAPPADAAKEKP